jgi:tRNA ligase
MFRKPVKEVSSSTRLIQQLYSFGLEDASSSDSTSPPASVPDQPEASTSALAPPIQALGKLSLAAPASKEPKVNNSLRKLLKSTQHSIKVDREDGTREEKVLTSWKMADYAYKRDPCPFPTRARGLFTEQVGEDEYRIVARGYDKFFNVNEVSWTQVSPRYLHRVLSRGKV